MNKHKRLLSFALALAMILSLFPLSAIATDDQSAACDHCGAVGGHLVGCEDYVAPTCEHCGVELVGESVVHSTACLTNCTCQVKPAEGEAHGETCKLYTPVNAATLNLDDTTATTGETTQATTEGTTVATTEGTTAATTEATTEPSTEATTAPTTEATTEPSTEATTEATTEPSTEATTESTVAVCDKCGMEECVCELVDLYLLKGAEIYKDYTDASETPKVIDEWNTGIKVKESITAEDGTVWYEFTYTSFWAELFNGYKYVKAEATTKMECTCEYIDGAHSEDCGLFVKETEGSVEYTDSSAAGICATVLAPVNAFPEGTVMTVTDTDVDMGAVDAAVNGAANFMLRRSAPVNSMEILGVKAVDISFGGEQPSEPVILKMDIPADEAPAGANKVVIVHFGEDGPENVASQYLLTNVDTHTVQVKVNGFSSYAAVFVNQKYNSPLMRDVLAGNSRFSVTTFKVDLFDYDPAAINAALNGVTSDGNGFHFTGYGVPNCSSNNGINNSSAEFAKQGVLESTLQNGLPVVKYLNGTNAGQNTGKVLFDDSYAANGKVIYKDIPFEVIYDNQTGYYEYKSSANHAQLNRAENKIELYADTLSTENSYVKTLDLSLHSGESDMTNILSTSSSFTATFKDTGGTVGRLDPYVCFEVPEVDASKVDKIYIKAKVPAEVGPNAFQLFFTTDVSTNYEEPKSFGNPTYSKSINYTPNGDWIEFVIDTSENSRWKDKIKSLRVDLFDGNKGDGSIDQTASYPIEISQISLIQEVDGYTTRGGFYPFSEIQDSYPGNNDGFSMSEWEAEMGRDTAAARRASRSIFNPTPSSEAIRYEELCYGLSMGFDFYLPVDRPENDLIYYFNGDDDLWVFVDDKLVLDIGGGHGAITGWVNFTTGNWEVQNAVTVTGYDSGATSDASKKSGTIDSGLYTPGKHTMKIFYLERGGSVSNCYMKYNLPQTPQGAVVVSKQVAEVEGADLSVLKNQKYTFEIKTQNQGAGDKTEYPYAGQKFIIVDYNGEESTGFDAVTTPDGKFELMHNQKAYFNIDENYKVTVKEAQAVIDGYDFIKVQVNNRDQDWLDHVTENKKEFVFNFVNTYNENEVTYNYVAVNPDGCPEAKLGTVKDPASTDYALETSETVGVRTQDPNGSTAKETDTVKFVGWFLDEACTQPVTDAEATVSGMNLDPKHPVKKDEAYVGDTFYAKFEYKLGHLTISKKGISDLDHHAGTPVNGEGEEVQSTIYRVYGTSLAGDEIDLEVVIAGNNSVTIRNIPVGTYTVEEKQNWSWRYTAAEGSKTAVIPGGVDPVEVAFENSRTNPFWLSGDNYVRNAWTNAGDLTKNYFAWSSAND